MNETVDRDILGHVYIPGKGGPVGVFTFILEPKCALSEKVEIDTGVVASTKDGDVIGFVVDMYSVSQGASEYEAIMASRHTASTLEVREDYVAAVVQVFHSEALRPVRSGPVRAANAAEIAKATGASDITWPISAGVADLLGGGFAKVAIDGEALLGPLSAHLVVGGLSGMASKTSFTSTLMKSAITAGDPKDHSVAVVIFNVKGDDLLFLDDEPGSGYELTETDEEIYKALGVPAEPFENVTVYAPSLPGGGGTRSARSDAVPVRWSLKELWPYLRYLLGAQVYEDEKLSSFFAEFRELKLNDHRNPILTIGQMKSWFDACFENMGDDTQYAWRAHHHMTMKRIERMMLGLSARLDGLLAKEKTSPEKDDIPAAGWSHGEVRVVDIAGLDAGIQGVAIARTIERLLQAGEDGLLGVQHLICFVDELNAWTGSEHAAVRKTLQRVATQGRYAGISLWGAAQALSKVDDLVVGNSATRALGRSAGQELDQYRQMTPGMKERLVTLDRGRMAINHPTLRGDMLIRFPRPAWRTGKPKTASDAGSTNRQQKQTSLDTLNVSADNLERIGDGLDSDTINRIIASNDGGEAAKQALLQARKPDPHQMMVTPDPRAPLDPDNPFDV